METWIIVMEVREVLKNKRRFQRITLKTLLTTISILTPKGNEIRKRYLLPLEDLSSAGLRYASKFAFPLGTKLNLVFYLDDRKVGAVAEVVRSQKTPDGKYDIGCKFIGINRLSQESITDYVTLSSVHDAQLSSLYSLPLEKRSSNVLFIVCGNCRWAEHVDKVAYCENCVKRFNVKI